MSLTRDEAIGLAHYETLTIGSLFSGIGGLELGLERAGLGPVLWQAEIDPFCRRVLTQHWPDARRYEDVREIDGSAPRVDVLCGGFPCQDISDASRGRGGGINGERSGLWRELVRVAADLRPRWVIVENVSGGAWRKWVPVVRGALDAIGYASVPVALSAAAVGAPFAGDRVFVAAANRDGEPAGSVDAKVAGLSAAPRSHRHWREPAPWGLGVDDGVPRGTHRRRALGNAVVPQVAEVIGRAILTTDAAGGWS